MRRCEWNKIVEQRLDHVRLDPCREQDQWNASRPCVDPPASRAAPQQEIETPRHQNRDWNGDSLRFKPVEEPAAPWLNRNSVVQRQGMVGNLGGKIEKRDDAVDRRDDDGQL